MSYELWAMGYGLWAVGCELWAVSCELWADGPMKFVVKTHPLLNL